MGWSERATVGQLVIFWHRASTKRITRFELKDDELFIKLANIDRDEALLLKGAMIASGLLDCEGEYLRIKGSSRKKPRPPSKDETELCRELWSEYVRMYVSRYRVKPLRNAKVNSQIRSLVRAVGKSEAPRVLRYYMRHSDAVFVRNHHTIGMCLANAQRLLTEIETGRVTYFEDAKRGEAKNKTDDAIKRYMEGK